MQRPLFAIYFGFSFLPWNAAVRAQQIRRLLKGCRACRTLNNILSVPASNLYASTLSLRFLANGLTPILIFPSPGPARTAALRPQFAFEASKCDFFAFQKLSYFWLPFFLEKNAKIIDLGSQNPPKIRPQCLQNRCPTKHAFFWRLFAYFGCFRLWALFLRSA